MLIIRMPKLYYILFNVNFVIKSKADEMGGVFVTDRGVELLVQYFNMET